MEQISRLSQIGMSWEPRQEYAWEKAYQSASSYYNQYGNLDIPVSYMTKEGVRLGKWMRRQREAYTNHALSRSRQERLERIGMVWEAQGPWKRNRSLAKQDEGIIEQDF